VLHPSADPSHWAALCEQMQVQKYKVILDYANNNEEKCKEIPS
jgi:hypothetical protein